MGFVMFLARKIQLEHKQSNIQVQLNEITRKLDDYTSFASVLSQDSISLSDVASIPSSLFGAGLNELGMMHGQAMQIANTQFGQAMSTGLFGQANNQFVIQLTQQKLYENARHQLQKQLQARLNEEEKQLQSRKTRLEVQSEVVNKELEAMDRQIAQGIKNQISTFGIQA